MSPAPSPTAEPDCPAAPGEAEAGTGAPEAPHAAAAGASLRAIRRPFSSIDAATWDALVDATPAATPFSRWAVHRAWWDAYGANAHEQTLAVIPAGAPDDAPPVAIVPLMHRHEVEPDDAILRTRMRAADRAPHTPVEPDRKAIFFGASYHADYATVLARPDDLPAVATAVAAALAEPGLTGDDHPDPWDVVDLRRLRHDDPAAGALAAALEAPARSLGWHVVREPEDVCPVLDLPAGMDFEAYLGTLPKKDRHEVRRKLRRAEAAGEVRLDRSAQPPADLDAFIELHQGRWGEEGLFPATPGGDQSRAFFAGLVRALRGGRLPGAPLPDGRRPADRRRASGSTTGGRSSSTTPAPTRTRATCRRASCSWRCRSGPPWRPAAPASISSAATSRTSTSGAPWTSRSSASSWSGEAG